ncbi:TadE/TadG family type IV pilus assembly protein [Lentzea sp. NPDC102401]|uniref:TadE/TadG family type IV pilus assembly protein n=1 Tax=Lentzea sp. NPDC102401 TaxID=3364128 RepID=UPI00381D0679
MELVIATPLLLLLILLIAQFALYMHATHIAQAAAAQALSAVRVSGGTSAGVAEGERVLAQLGSGPLQGTSVSVQRGPSQASALITGSVINVLPFTNLAVRAEAVGPVEKFTPPTSTRTAAS